MLHFARMLLGRTSGAAPLDSQTVTSGASGSAINQDRVRGFAQGSLGSISDGTSNLYGGAAVLALLWDENGGSPSDLVQFQVAGVRANSGWTTMSVGGINFSRAAATFSTAGGNTSWIWNNLGYTAGTNPFGGSGADHSVVFT
jgi:hypothetical protein